MGAVIVYIEYGEAALREMELQDGDVIRVFEAMKGTCGHELESSAVLTRMTDLLVALLVWCDDRV